MNKMRDLLHKKQALYLMVIAFVLVVLVSAMKYRSGEINYYNSDATWHTLLTIKAYDETPVSEHLFLPIVSLGDPDDQYIPWGATMPNDRGVCLYTSFSSAGYFLPWLFIKLFRLSVTEKSLYIFNSLLFALSAVLWTWLIHTVYEKDDFVITITVVGMLTYIFSPELFHGMGVVYWHHSIMQVTLLIQMIAYYNLTKFGSKKAKIIFYIMVFVNPYIEWTGYMANAGFALTEIALNWRKNRGKGIGEAYIIGVLSMISFGAFAMHFLMRMDEQMFFDALGARFMARNISSEVLLTDVFGGYFKSFLYLWVLLLFLIVRNLIRYHKIELRHGILMFILIFPCLENILMKEHAFYYTYDRMKFIFILSFLICELSHCLLSNAKEKRYEQVLLFLVTILVCGLNLDTYKKNESYIWETDYRNDNLILAEYISENYSDSILATESRGAVRGYINTLFDRGIYEGTGQYELDAMAVSKGKRYSVMIDLESADALENWCLFKIDKVVICDTEIDRITEISVLDGDIKSVEKQYCYTKEYRLADITDENWTYGCSNSENLLLFYREDDLLVECLTNERIVCGGEMYQIESVDFDDDWIRVSVDHNADICRYPSKLRFVKVKNKETE